MAGHVRVHGEQSVGKPFPLHLGEYWLSVKDEQGVWIANDIRAQVKARSKVLCMDSWQASRPQGLFAGPSILPLCNMLLASQDRQMTSTLLRVVTNTYEYYWDAEDEKEHVKKHKCECDNVTVLDVTHMLTCASWCWNRVSVGNELLLLLFDLAVNEPSVQQWLDTFALGRQSEDDGLGELIVALMLNPDSYTEVDQHRVMFGGFSHEEGQRALSRLGVDLDNIERESLLSTVRLILFEQFVR
jgi:hypothetical protein